MAAETTAAIAIIGDEILSGKYADENSRLAIDELRALGVRLQRIVVLPDDEEDIGATVAELSRRFDLVLTTGGVGPTHDDVTMAGIARGFGVPVVRHPALVELLRRYYGGAPTDAQLRLAEVPDGAELIELPGLEAPAVRVRNVYVFPGVPSLFRKKLRALRDRFRAAPFVVARLFLAVDETVIADRLTKVAADHPTVSIGSYPRFDQAVFELILTIEGKDAGAVAAAHDALVAALGELVTRSERPS